MRFDKISITNTRLIGENALELSFRKDKNIFVLLGDNGYGKTTILDAMATALAVYAMQFPGIQDYQISDLDVHINRHGHRASYSAITAELTYEGNPISVTRYRKGVANTPKTNYDQIKQLALEKKEAIIRQEEVALPIFAYYGTGRGQFSVPERKRGFQKTYERWDCYKSAIKPETDFKRFFGWFDLMESEELHKMKELQDFNYKSRVLEVVRSAISMFVDCYQNPRIKVSPLRFIMDRVEKDGTRHELRIEQLSDGYKIVIAMVADLAARMAEANPKMPNALHAKGVVLIDEVDLHLHPNWQRTILRKLHDVFPNIQFIVSTHSPIIVVGSSDIAQVINLNNPTEEVPDISKSNVGLVLLSELFGLSSLKSPIWDEKIKERENILSKSELSEDDKERLEQLNQEMNGLSIQDPNIIRTNELLEKIANELHIQL